MSASEIARGELYLGSFIDIEDKGREPVTTITPEDAVQVRGG